MTGLCYLVPLPELHDSEGTGEGLCGEVLDDQGGFLKSFWQPRSKTVTGTVPVSGEMTWVLRVGKRAGAENGPLGLGLRKTAGGSRWKLGGGIL